MEVFTNNNPNDPFAEINQQVTILEDAVGKELASFRVLSNEVKILEKNLDEFLTEYYKKVGVLFEELRQINIIVDSVESGNRSNVIDISGSHSGIQMNDDSEYPEENDNQEEERDIFSLHENELPAEHEKPDYEIKDQVTAYELKRIYRKLAKICHPDIFPNDPYAKEIFANISNAYRNKDLATLIKIEQIFIEKRNDMQENPIEKLERLERQYESLLKNHDSLKQRKNELINSPSYKLKQKIAWHKMCGEDLMAITIEKTSHEIAEKRDYLYRRYGKTVPDYIVRDNRFYLATNA